MTANKTGTLNTKTLTASQLATNSPILPHKFEHNSQQHHHHAPSGVNHSAAARDGGGREPPALPPRGIARGSAPPQGSGGRKVPPEVPPKRSSLSNLALYDNVSRRHWGNIFSELLL